LECGSDCNKIRPSKSKRKEDRGEIENLLEDEDDYSQEIYLYCREREKRFHVSSNFLVVQPEINDRLRKIMIDWVIKLHHALQLLPETLYLSVNIMDRYLCIAQFRKDIYQLIAISAVLAASKYEEVHPPQIEDFLTVTRNLFSRNQIIKMEYILLVSLSFNLSSPSSFQFLEYFLHFVGADETEMVISYYLLESTLMDPIFYSLLPSQIASGVIYLSNLMQSETLPWPNSLSELTNYSVEMVKPWAALIRNHLSRLRTSTTLKGIVKKYQSEEFYQVAFLSLPKVFLNESWGNGKMVFFGRKKYH